MCAWSRRVRRIFLRPRLPEFVRCGGRCTAVRTRRFWKCSMKFIAKATMVQDSLRLRRTKTAAKNSWASAIASIKISIRARKSLKKPVTKFCPNYTSVTVIFGHCQASGRSCAEGFLFRQERKLYPNVDFYSGIIMRALGIPVEMFPVIFAIGRMPGWIANYKEILSRKRTEEPHFLSASLAPDLYRAHAEPLRSAGTNGSRFFSSSQNLRKLNAVCMVGHDK